jgi:hypothetical protein
VGGYFAQRNPIRDAGSGESRSTEKTSTAADPGRPESTRLDPAPGQSRGNPDRGQELEAAIANVTRLLSKTDDPETAQELVAERKAMRSELEALQRPANVTPIGARRRGGR